MLLYRQICGLHTLYESVVLYIPSTLVYLLGGKRPVDLPSFCHALAFRQPRIFKLEFVVHLTILKFQVLATVNQSQIISPAPLCLSVGIKRLCPYSVCFFSLNTILCIPAKSFCFVFIDLEESASDCFWCI